MSTATDSVKNDYLEQVVKQKRQLENDLRARRGPMEHRLPAGVPDALGLEQVEHRIEVGGRGRADRHADHSRRANAARPHAVADGAA